VCFENGWRFDLSFHYPSSKILQIKDSSFLEKINSIVNQFWFMAVMVLVKLGRKDYLIAAHLVLELCQLIVVIQMMERDNAKGTNMHRFGDGEDVPVLQALFQSDGSTEDIILAILFEAAKHMDEIAATVDRGYTKRTNKLRFLTLNRKVMSCEKKTKK